MYVVYLMPKSFFCKSPMYVCMYVCMLEGLGTCVYICVSFDKFDVGNIHIRVN